MIPLFTIMTGKTLVELELGKNNTKKKIKNKNKFNDVIIKKKKKKKKKIKKNLTM